jgi:hypothetical protein
MHHPYSPTESQHFLGHFSVLFDGLSKIDQWGCLVLEVPSLPI